MDILHSLESVLSRCLLTFKGQKRSFCMEDDFLPRPPKVSFCTACMGRLQHLKETLPQNLEENQDYPHVEFVLLNYNSPDGLDEWVGRVMKEAINQGRLKYFYTRGPKYFHMAHAKNLAHQLATGDILCNLDADNFAGRGFARFLADTFVDNKNQVIQGDLSVSKGASGRVIVPKKYFMMAGGYDERMQGWGFEEQDLVRRLCNGGLEYHRLNEGQFLRTIEHDSQERFGYFAPQWRNKTATHRRNRIISWSHLASSRANEGKTWGRINE